MATIRAVAHHEHLSQRCLERIDKAERVVPKMQATIEFVSEPVCKGHALAARRLTSRWIMALLIHASGVAGKASQS